MKYLKYPILHIALAALAFAACDEIAEEDRLIYMAPAEVNRAVLIEDFTGQKCINCPNATETIEALHEQYGDAIIAVAIHGGSFGVKAPKGLATDEATAYYDYWKITEQPSGVINRNSGVLAYQEWGSYVKTELEKTSSVGLSLTTTATSSNTLNIVVTSEALSYKGKLQLWLLEDSISGAQYMPDGSAKKDYNHMHVYRASINGVWGTDIEHANNIVTNQFTYTFDASAMKLENLSVVAFVYNDEGVENVAKCHVIIDN